METSLHVRYGHFKDISMPFDITNIPTIFQHIWLIWEHEQIQMIDIDVVWDNSNERIKIRGIGGAESFGRRGARTPRGKKRTT